MFIVTHQIIRKWVFISAVVLLKSVLFSPVNAQSAVPFLKHFSPQQGLPSWNVTCAVRDKDGFLWFGTANGVSRFDGLNFKTFKVTKGLEDNYINFIQATANGIAVYCSACGISFIENNSITNYKYNALIKSLTKDLRVLDFYIDKNDAVFISIADKGIKKIAVNGQITDVIKMPTTNTYYINNLCDDHLMYTIAAGPDFLSSLNYKTCDKPSFIIDSLRGFSESMHVLKLSDSELLFSTGIILWKFANHTCKEVLQASSVIVSLYASADGTVWIATNNDGVIVLNFKDGTTKSILKGVSISALVQDNEGGFWIGTSQDGIYYAPKISIFNINKSTGLAYEVLTSIACDSSTIYGGLNDGSILSVSTKGYEFQSLSEEIKAPVTQLIYEGKTAKLYAASYYTFEKAGSKYKALTDFSNPGNQQCMMINGDIVLYAAGKSLLQITNGVVSKCCEFPYQVTSLTKDEKFILVGTDSGLFTLSDTKIVKPYFADIALLKNKVTAVCKSAYGYYLAIENKGILFINNEKDTFLINNELENVFVKSMIADADTIWAASNQGLFRIEIIDFQSKKYNCYRVDAADGLGSNALSGLVLRNDTIWVSSNKGIDFFQASASLALKTPPLVYIYSVSVNDSDVFIKPYYDLNYDYKSIRISFAAIAFRGANQTSFKYRLNQEAAWHFTTSHELQFLSLSPGDYQFEVYAKNSSGIWSDKPAIVNFTVHPPWWETWWFRIGFLLLLIAIIVIIVRRRINYITFREAEKTTINKRTAELEMKALRAQMNPHFIFNVMNSIQHYMLQNDTERAQRYLSKFAKLIRLILDNSSLQEVTLADELKSLDLYVELEQQRFENKFDYVVNIDDSINTNDISIPSMLLQPYIENAIKHGISHLKTKGLIKLTVTNQVDFVAIDIEDNGVGRAFSALKKQNSGSDHVSHGTAITTHRIEAYNISNTLKITAQIVDLVDADNNAIGTKVELKIPIS